MEYFKELYTVPLPAKRLAGGALCAAVFPNPPIRKDPPSTLYQEVKRVVLELMGDRGAGVFGVQAKLLKAVGESMTRRLHAVIV